MSACILISIHISVYIYIYIYTYTDTYMYTRTPTDEALYIEIYALVIFQKGVHEALVSRLCLESLDVVRVGL